MQVSFLQTKKEEEDKANQRKLRINYHNCKLESYTIVILNIDISFISSFYLVIFCLYQFKDLKDVFGKAATVLFADAHKKRVGEG